MPLPDPAEEALAQLVARLLFAFQCDKLHQRSTQCACEYQSILLSLDVKRHLQARAVNLFNVGLALATGVSLTGAALFAKALLRGTGPYARLLCNAGMRQQGAVAAARQTAVIGRLTTLRHGQYQAAAAAGRMLAPPMWVVRELQIVPAILLRQLYKESGTRLLLAAFIGSIPTIAAHSYTNDQLAGHSSGELGQGWPKGNVGTLYHLLTEDRSEATGPRISAERVDAIMRQVLSGFPSEYQALLCMTDEELLSAICELDMEVSKQLRENPNLKKENPSEEVLLFLRARVLMEYWLRIQHWVQAQLPKAQHTLAEACRRLR